MQKLVNAKLAQVAMGACETDLGDALCDLDAQHDGVLFVEDAGGDDLELAGEHGHKACRLLLRLLELLHVRLRRQG